MYFPAALHDRLSHLCAHRFIIEGNIEIHAGILDQPVVCDHLDSGIFCLIHHIGKRVGIDTHHNNDIHPFLNKILDLGNLLLNIPVGILDIDLCPHLLCRGYEHVSVALPSLDHKRVKAHADPDFALLSVLLLVICFLCPATADQHTEAQREQGDTDYRSFYILIHPISPPCTLSASHPYFS